MVSRGLLQSAHHVQWGLSWISLNLIHTYTPSLAGQTWRLKHGKSRSGTEYGPLTDLPDWSFTDGTKAPLGKGQKQRIKKQAAINNRVMRLMKEMRTAKRVTDEQSPAQ